VAALSGAKKVVINFLGGNDLMMEEVLDAAGLLAQNMGDAAPSKMTFNSISHKDIADGTASVTVMAAGGGNADGALGEAVANGEAYFYQGKWYAVLDEDIIKE
jgi:cell division GTPase FtsZ